MFSDPRNPYGGVDLSQYVGLKVTAHGTPQFNADGLYVSQIQPAEAPSLGFPPGTVVTTFELRVKGEVTAGTVFFGNIGSPEVATVLLIDQDSDDVYALSLPIERGTEQEVLIKRSDPISDDSMAPFVSSTRTFTDFGLVKFEEDKTFRAKVNFKRDQGEDDTETPEETPLPTQGPGSGGSDDSGSNGGGSGVAPDLTAPENGVDLNEDGSIDGADSETAATTSDATGGASVLPIASVAVALLVLSSLLIRRLSR